MAASAEAVIAPGCRPYVRRRPERGTLHRVLRRHLNTFFAERQARERPLPKYVADALRGLLGCGDLAGGFARFRCGGCGTDRLVAFSCKDRSICASCMSRRQTEIAAHLTDRVLPAVRLRQWTLSLPHRLRLLLAFDHDLCLAVHRVYWRALRTFHRKRARRLGLAPEGAEIEAGGFTVIQRFGSSCELNLHFHTPMLDGVYVRTLPDAAEEAEEDAEQDADKDAEEDRPPIFVRLPDPTADEVSALCDTIATRVRRLLIRRGHWEDDDEGGRATELDDPPPMADLFAASIQQRGATGTSTGKRLLRLRHAPRRPFADGRKARRHGFDLHAGRPIGAKRKDRREQLCRYLLRPALSADRLDPTPDGQILLAIKTPWSDGTTHLKLSPTDLIARLAALVCRPRANQILYMGVLSPHHRWRADVTPAPPPLAPVKCVAAAGPAEPAKRPPANDSWAQLMQRGLQIDTLACPNCGGRFRHIANIMTRDAIRRILRHLGIQSEPPDLAPARAPDQPDLFA